jgi:hypothetical protein
LRYVPWWTSPSSRSHPEQVAKQLAPVREFWRLINLLGDVELAEEVVDRGGES